MNYKPMIMFAPEGGGAATMMGELGAEIDETEGADVGAATPGDETEPSESPTEPVVTTAPAVPSFTMDPQTLAAALKAAGVGAQPVPQPGPKAPLTPEERAELQKQLRYWEANPEFITKFNNLETQQQAFQELRDGLTNQFVAILQAYVGEREQTLTQQFNPALEYIKQQEYQRNEEDFGKSYPGLSAPALKPIKDAVVAHLLREGKTFSDKKSMFAAVAEGMKAIAPQLDTSPGSSPGDKPTTNAIKPAPSRGSGGVGGGSAGGGASGVPKAVSLLPKIGR